MRVKGGTVHVRKRKKILKLAKGFRGKRHSCWRIAKQAVMKALKNAYISRRLRKREFRRLWILRVNAASRQHGLRYSEFMGGLTKAGVKINRKMLADLAIRDPEAFARLVELARSHLPAPASASASASRPS